MLPAGTAGEAEAARLAALDRYRILDTPPEESFDRITRLVRALLGTPIALVSLIDRDRQWFKSRQGLDATETPRDVSFCGHAILRDEPMVVRDAWADPRFHDNPLVTGEPHIRFYAGVPLRTPDGHNLGTLCALDRVPRELSADEIQVLRDLGSIVVDELELRLLASEDSLTGARTRRAFLAEGNREVERARRYGHALCCLVLDIDHFKSVNDRFGHGTGDAVIRQVVAACEAELRDSDAIGRIGGEEFAVLLPETPLSGAVEAAERIRGRVARLAIAGPSGPVRVTVSIGAAAAEPDDRYIAVVLARADEALYRAKEGGRDRVVAAGPG